MLTISSYLVTRPASIQLITTCLPRYAACARTVISALLIPTSPPAHRSCFFLRGFLFSCERERGERRIIPYVHKHTCINTRAQTHERTHVRTRSHARPRARTRTPHTYLHRARAHTHTHTIKLRSCFVGRHSAYAETVCGLACAALQAFQDIPVGSLLSLPHFLPPSPTSPPSLPAYPSSAMAARPPPSPPRPLPSSLPRSLPSSLSLSRFLYSRMRRMGRLGAMNWEREGGGRAEGERERAQEPRLCRLVPLPLCGARPRARSRRRKRDGHWRRRRLRH